MHKNSRHKQIKICKARDYPRRQFCVDTFAEFFSYDRVKRCEPSLRRLWPFVLAFFAHLVSINLVVTMQAPRRSSGNKRQTTAHANNSPCFWAQFGKQPPTKQTSLCCRRTKVHETVLLIQSLYQSCLTLSWQYLLKIPKIICGTIDGKKVRNLLKIG